MIRVHIVIQVWNEVLVASATHYPYHHAFFRPASARPSLMRKQPCSPGRSGTGGGGKCCISNTFSNWSLRASVHPQSPPHVHVTSSSSCHASWQMGSAHKATGLSFSLMDLFDGTETQIKLLPRMEQKIRLTRDSYSSECVWRDVPLSRKRERERACQREREQAPLLIQGRFIW
jgi:hypothetical protein